MFIRRYPVGGVERASLPPSSENQQQNNDDDQHGDNAAADIHNYLLSKIDDSFPIVLDQLKS